MIEVLVSAVVALILLGGVWYWGNRKRIALALELELERMKGTDLVTGVKLAHRLEVSRMETDLQKALRMRDSANADLTGELRVHKAERARVESELALFKDGHEWHIGGRHAVHGRPVEVKYECPCGASYYGPEKVAEAVSVN